MIDVCIFLDFDETITRKPSHLSTYPFGIEDNYYDNLKKFMKSYKSFLPKKYNIKSIHILTRNNYSFVKDACKKLDLNFDSYFGAYETIDTLTGLKIDDKIKININNNDKIETYYLPQDYNISEYWSFIKYDIMKKYIKKNNIDYAIFFDDDYHNHNHIYGSIIDERYIKPKYNGYYRKNINKINNKNTGNDYQIIPIVFPFENRFFKNNSGIFHNLTDLKYEFSKIPEIIKIRCFGFLIEFYKKNDLTYIFHNLIKKYKKKYKTKFIPYYLNN